MDLNADLGESFGAFQVGEDQLLLDCITSANIACGFHGGDFNVMEQTVRLAKERGVAVGAHPGLPDIMGFGRRVIDVTPEEVYRMLIYQIGALNGFCKVHGVTMQHVKPHGALYHMANQREDIADEVVRATKDSGDGLILFAMSQSKLHHAAEKAGITVAREAFADRTYTLNGELTPRREPSAVIKDRHQLLEHVEELLVNGRVRATDGTLVPMEVDTLCFHGDGESAVPHIEMVISWMKNQGIGVQKAGECNE
ncbi:LamB/YcsF family protein [Pontibacillus halophilus JSM 076056 = DSM 19796]|uniref:LamB/YcsF family protein n=1 Tax=Pontibacillus halophilus JSM 076056 = DSM 19796 TaxID=1385510 RepID=A0A0A5GKY8_9BACI|nr:LamB/YcsF family protein [Pontibacillus halophilus JSM 076056 = DSM 19796]